MKLAAFLLADDMVATIAFYRDVLGFTLNGSFGDPPAWCHLSRDEAQLMFLWYPPHDHGPDDDHEHLPPTMTGMIYLYPDDIRALYERVKQQWEIADELGPRPHGMVEFDVFDPNGYRVRFGANPS